MRKNKLVTAGRLLAVLDISPSTTIKGATLFTAPSTLHYYGAQSWPQTKQNKQTRQCQTTLTPCWDVNGCQGRSTLYYYMLGHPTQPKGPSKTRRASKQSMITRAHDSLQNHNFVL